jgi:DNA invertase Pin-like site-specific DNA recombinase
MKQGDLLVCAELSRLGRNMMMVMSILNVCSRKGIHVYSIKDHFELSDDLQSKIVAFAFSLAAEIERNLISQRTREALAAKKQEGVKLGRPKGKTAARRRFDAMLPEIIEMKQKGEDTDAIAARLGIHRNTFYRYLRAATEENAKK